MPDETVTHYPYPDGIHVEVIIDDGNGDVSAISIDFDVVDENQNLLRPRENLPESFEEDIIRHLSDAGYELTNLRISS